MKRIASLIITLLLLAGVVAPGCNGGGGDGDGGTGYVPPPPKPAEFVVSDLAVPSEPVVAGSPLTVEVQVENVGELSGTYDAVLQVEGQEVETRELTLAGGESKTVSFSIVIDTGGSYEVVVGDTSGTLEILPIPLSSAVLNLGDLPRGFGVFTLEELGITMDEVAADFEGIGGEPHDYFGFLGGESLATFEMVYGLHLYPLTALGQTSFNILIDDADKYAADFAEALTAEGTTVISYETLAALSDIGDKSIGIRLHIESEGITMVMDVVMFRNGEVFTVLYVLWLEGYTPVASSEELAYILDGKVATALASVSGPFEVTFPDPNLEAAIREAIDKPQGPIYTSDLESLTTLGFFAEDRGISNITGLEYCINLQILDLWDNNITDLSPLAGLTKLRMLAVPGNNISDITPLAGLTNLEELYLARNNISDLSPLAGLTNLEWLSLWENNISDISPLVENNGLSAGDYVDLRNNPLSTTSVNIYIPQLEARGVSVQSGTR